MDVHDAFLSMSVTKQWTNQNNLEAGQALHAFVYNSKLATVLFDVMTEAALLKTIPEHCVVLHMWHYNSVQHSP